MRSMLRTRNAMRSMLTTRTAEALVCSTGTYYWYVKYIMLLTDVLVASTDLFPPTVSVAWQPATVDQNT